MPLARKTNVRYTAIAHMSVNDVGSPLASSSPTTSTLTKAMMISNFKNRLDDYYRQKLEKLEMMRGLILTLASGISDVVYTDLNVEQENLKTTEICREMPPPPGTVIVKKRATRSTLKRAASDDLENRAVFKRKNSIHAGLKTPCSKGRSYQVAAVTPGASLTTPSVYRKPCAGEQVISMSGSPILVSTENMTNNVPQMHIPLADGRVFAVMPNGLADDMPDFPQVDSETKKQLKMLRLYLEKKILD